MIHKVHAPKKGERYAEICSLKKASLFLILSLVFLAVVAPNVSAAGTPAKLIVFTDKKVYYHTGIDPRSLSSDGYHPDPTWVENENLTMIAYAVVLDDDGNIIKNVAGSISAIVNDVKILHHNNDTSRDDRTHHSEIINNPSYVYVTVSSFKDDGATYDSDANDGINAAILDILDFVFADPFTWNSSTFSYSDAHVLLEINVTYSGAVTLNETVYVMISTQNCHSGDEEQHKGVNAHDAAEGSSMMPCTICHWGYDHLFNANQFPEIPAEFADVHVNKIVFPSGLETLGFQKALSFHYNTSYDEGTDWADWGEYGGYEYNASKYCYVCHYATNGGSLLEYDGQSGTAHNDLSERPSCSVASKSLSVGTVTCHSTTNISATPVPSWEPSMMTSDDVDNLYNVTEAKSHNRTALANVSCAICHGTVHNFKLPNMSYVDYTINEQCWSCHDTDDDGYIAGIAMSSDCKGCHQNTSTNKLDAHAPGADASNESCISCHNIGGSATNVNVSSMNATTTVHRLLNNRSGDPGYLDGIADWNNRRCWACHGNGTKPSEGHADLTNMTTPWKCWDCHNATNRLTQPYHNYSTAANVSEHVQEPYQEDIKTNGTGSTGNGTCQSCHANDLGDSGGSQDGGILSASLLANVSHYAQNDSLMPTTYCLYCHNSSVNASKWGNASLILESSVPPNTGHPGKSATTNSECYNCHGGEPDTFHNDTLNPGAGTCRDCHFSYDITGSKFVNETMYSESVHGNQSVIDCTDCHTNYTYDGTNHTDATWTPPESGWKWCEDCHVVNQSISKRSRHNLTSYPQSNWYDTTYTALNVTDCTWCHNTAIYNDAKATYNRSSGKDCRFCHPFPDLRPGGD